MLLPTIKKECSKFLTESRATPLLKNLPTSYDGFSKIKVRVKNKNEIFIDAFNLSFSKHKRNLFQRAIFANGEISFTPSVEEKLEPFYIFPINGFKFIYNPVVTNAFENYKHAVENLMKYVPSETVAIEMFSKVIQSSYRAEKLDFGILCGSEIIIYNIPYYYAIRKSLIDDYSILG